MINTAFEGVDAHRVWHICYGNQGGNPGVEEPRGQDMFPFAFAADVDQIHIETMRRGLRATCSTCQGLPGHMSLGVGVIDVKSHGDREARGGRRPARRGGTVRARGTDRVSTDCGMLNLKREHAQRKLEALVEGTRIARERLS